MSSSDNKGTKPHNLRGKLTGAFIESLEVQWQEHGDDILDKLRQENPSKFAEIVARLCPQESHVAVSALDLPDSLPELENLMVESMASDLETAERCLRKARKLAKQQAAERPPESEINRKARIASRERAAQLRRSAPAWPAQRD